MPFVNLYLSSSGNYISFDCYHTVSAESKSSFTINWTELTYQSRNDYLNHIYSLFNLFKQTFSALGLVYETRSICSHRSVECVRFLIARKKLTEQTFFSWSTETLILLFAEEISRFQTFLNKPPHFSAKEFKRSLSWRSTF